MSNQPLSRESQLRVDRDAEVVFSHEQKQLIERISELIGDEPRAAFARRCGLSESLVRSYLAGTIPSVIKAAQIALAGNVSLEWLATGQGPRERSAFAAPQRSPVVFSDQARLQATIEAVEEGLAMINRKLSPAVYAEVVALAYVIMGSPDSTKATVHQVVRYAA
jgi:transcriptional regulator with XRE-family HTH domain